VKKLLNGDVWPGIEFESTLPLATKFRLLMTSNPTYERHGPVRVGFYGEVITKAKAVSFSLPSSTVILRYGADAARAISCSTRLHVAPTWSALHCPWMS
jgi:hypothetical protein